MHFQKDKMILLPSQTLFMKSPPPIKSPKQYCWLKKTHPQIGLWRECYVSMHVSGCFVKPLVQWTQNSILSQMAVEILGCLMFDRGIWSCFVLLWFNNFASRTGKKVMALGLEPRQVGDSLYFQLKHSPMPPLGADEESRGCPRPTTSQWQSRCPNSPLDSASVALCRSPWMCDGNWKLPFNPSFSSDLTELLSE